MATVMMPSQNVVVVPAPERTGLVSNYASKTSFFLGGTQIVVGLSLAVFPIAVFGSIAYLLFGLLILAAGICGVAAGHVKKSCQIIGFMVVCIITSVIAVPNFIVSLTAVANGYNTHAALVVLTVFLLIESIASIWSAAICCRAVCCGRRANTGVPIQYCAQTGQVMMTVVNPAQMPQQQQAVLGTAPPPPYAQQGAAASAPSSAFSNQVYSEEPPSKY